MDVIHFTKRAADPLKAFGAAAAAPAVSFLPLADGKGDTHISYLHLEMNGKIDSPSVTHAAALLCVHGSITLTTQIPRSQIDVYAGMGAILDRHEAYSLKSEEGAILLIVESEQLTAHTRAISTPQRIAGATWPDDGIESNGV
jgi:hypothetical protein